MLKKTITIISILFITSCSSSKRPIHLIPPDKVVIDKRYGVFDLNYYVDEMVQYMRANKLFNIPNPIIEISDIVIDDSVEEYVDPKLIQDKIKIDLMNSGLAKFIKPQKERDKYPNYVKAPYRLEGRLSSIKKDHPNKDIDYYYILTMDLIDTSTSVSAWANKVEIRKDNRK